jgi:hypothetical protein
MVVGLGDTALFHVEQSDWRFFFFNDTATTEIYTGDKHLAA